MLDRLIRRVGILLTVFGTVVFVTNCITTYSRSGIFINESYDVILLICTLAIFISSFFPIGRFIHIISLGFASLVSLYNDPSDGVTFAVIILTLLLMYKYKFFEKRVILKLSSTFLLIIAVLVAATWHYIDSLIKTGEYTLTYILQYPILNFIFFIVFLSALILIMYDEIAVYVSREKKYKREIKDLNVTIEQTQEYLKKIDANFIDPVQAGLTKKELILLESLCLYRESNIDLAQRLGKSPNTIKVQLTRIMNKIGAETRYQLIDLCRHYFIENKTEKAEAKV